MRLAPPCDEHAYFTLFCSVCSQAGLGHGAEKTRSGSTIKAMEKTGVALTDEAEQLKQKDASFKSNSSTSSANSTCFCSVQ